MPENLANALMRSAPSADPRSCGEIDWFGPRPTHDCATSPCPLCWNCLSRSFKPPRTTLPAAPPANRPPNPLLLSRSPSPPALVSPDAGDAPGAVPGDAPGDAPDRAAAPLG